MKRTQLRKAGKQANKKTSKNKNKSSKTGNGKSKGFTKKKRPVRKNKEVVKNGAVEENKLDTMPKDTRKRKCENQKEIVIPVKKRKNHSEDVAKLMEIYEQLRQKTLSLDARHQMIDQVMTIIKGKENEVIHKHDTVRVLEMCVKFGSEDQKVRLFQLFQENTVSLATSKYAKFLVEKFMDHGSKEQRKKIIESFYGKVNKLLRNKYAAVVLDKLYDKYATTQQKSTLVDEFYGPEYQIFKVVSGEDVDKVLQGDDEKKKTAILKYMKDSLMILCQKDVVSHSIVHKVLSQFLKYANIQQKIDLLEILKDNVTHILHTKDGARAAMNCLWLGSAKDRKVILKSFKTFVVKICKEEYGHLVMLALFDTVDDTVLVKKALFPELLSNLQELMEDAYGRKVILYLLKARSKSYFSPDVTKLLQQGDGNAHSKKEACVKQDELRQGLLPDLYSVLNTHIKQIVRNKSASIVLLAALEIPTEETGSLLKAIASLLTHEIETSVKIDKTTEENENNEEEVVCHECGHWVVKNIIKQDKQRIERRESVTFSELLCDEMEKGSFMSWSTNNRACFVLVSLLESNIASVVTRIREELNAPQLKNQLANMNSSPTKGLEILLKVLQT